MISVHFQINSPVDNFISAIGMMNSYEVPINSSWQEPLSLQPGLYCAQFKQHDVIYAAGRYRISVGLSIGLKNIQYIEDAIDLPIVEIIEEVQSSVVKYDSASGIILNQLIMRTESIKG